jgi:hypothetical protein
MASKRRFVLGLSLLIVAVAFAGWGFYLGELTPDQRKILLWVLPLASGVGAAAFAGGIKAKLDGLIPGVAITAAGGFAVWCLSFFFLFPASASPVGRPGMEITFPRELSLQHAINNVANQANVTIVLANSCDELKKALVPVGPHRGESVQKLVERIVQRTPVNGIGPVRRISDERFEIDCS